MELYYSDESIRKALASLAIELKGQQIDFHTRHPAVGYLINPGVRRTFSGCILETDHKGLFVVLLDAWNIHKVVAYQFLNFSDMQGIRVKQGRLNYVITIQCMDGNRYKFQAMKRNTKHLSNQQIHIERIISEMEKLELHDMHYNANYRIRRRKEHADTFLYTVTLLMSLIPALILAVTVMLVSNTIFVGIVIGTFLIHALLYSTVKGCCKRMKEGKFQRTYHTIMEQYKKTQDPKLMHTQLTQMKNIPKTKQEQEVYVLSIVNALYQSGKKEEALKYLDNIQSEDSTFNETLQKFKEQILNE